MSIKDTHPFIVRTWDRKLLQAPRLRVSWREKMRVKRVVAGLFNEVEVVGRDHSTIHVQACSEWFPESDEYRQRVLSANGTGGQNAAGRQVPATAAGIKSAVRRIRQQEAERIDAIDARIAELRAEIVEQQRLRKEAVSDAWTRGNVVRLSEATPTCDKGDYIEGAAVAS